jgi:hypothetical protein
VKRTITVREPGKDPKEYDIPDGYAFSSSPDGRVKMTPPKERKPRRAKKTGDGKDSQDQVSRQEILECLKDIKERLNQLSTIAKNGTTTINYFNPLYTISDIINNQIMRQVNEMLPQLPYNARLPLENIIYK